MLLNPEWQVLAEEKRITTQLREWGQKDLPDYKGRYDFLALGSEGLLAIIEIKRPDHPAELAEMNKLIELPRQTLGRTFESDPNGFHLWQESKSE